MEGTRNGGRTRAYAGRKDIVLAGFAGALSAPEVAWSLIDAGFKPVFFGRRGRAEPVRHSRYVSVREITAPEENVEVAMSDLSKVIAECDEDGLGGGILFPLDDSSLWLCSRLSLPERWKLAGPRGENANLALNKWTQVAAAQSAGFSVPSSCIATGMSELEPSRTRFPLIMRPANAVLVEGSRFARGANWICADEIELERAFTAWKNRGPLLVQDFIEGSGEGIFGLATIEGVKAMSSHRRLRMMNPHGSGSSACAAQPVPDEVRESVERFIRNTGWQGIFMIELLRERSGRRWFIEFNGRSWGSMALARRQGLEYPAWAVRHALDSGFVPPPLSSLGGPIECRNLGRELVHLLFVLRGSKSGAIKSWPSFWSSVRDLLRFPRRSAFYNWRSDDWKVFVADGCHTIREQVFKSRY